MLWDGTNVDDLADFRPGHRALRELGVQSPLLAAHLGKAAIRTLSRGLGLDGERPSQSCLATRFPYDTELTREDLARVGRAEAWLRRRGFSRVRLRVRGARPAWSWRRKSGRPSWPQGCAAALPRSITALGFTGLCLDGDV